MRAFLQRLTTSTAIRGMAMLAGAFGITVAPEFLEAILAIAMAISGGTAILKQD